MAEADTEDYNLEVDEAMEHSGVSSSEVEECDKNLNTSSYPAPFSYIGGSLNSTPSLGGLNSTPSLDGLQSTPSLEGRITPATDHSGQSETSKSCSGSGRYTPASQSDVSVSLSSSEKSTPSRKRRSTSSTGRKIEFDNASTSSGSIKLSQLPSRLGIKWVKGEKIEAMDFMHKWYAAKLVEINEEDEEVLIHFDGWNQRYDEWVKMSSDRIRPATRHSDRKDFNKRKKMGHKVGDQVYAKWTDCKMYPAKITTVLPNGSFEVLFYDGFKKVVQPINITPLPQDLKQRKLEPPPKIASQEIKKSRQLKDANVFKSSPSSSTSSVSGTEVVKKEERRKVPSDPRRKKERGQRKKPRMIVAGSFLSRKQKMKEERDQESITVPVTGKPETVMSEPVSTQTEYSESKVELSVTPEPSKMEVKQELAPSTSLPVPIAAIKTEPSTGYQPPAVALPSVVPPKAFVVEPDHNRFKCMFEGCNKGFRKEHLLEYHIKYYHVKGNQPGTPQPTRKRRKTTSICSSNPDQAGSIKKAVMKKQRHTSAESALVLAKVSSPGEVKVEPDVQVAAPEEREIEVGDVPVTVKDEPLPAEELPTQTTLEEHLLQEPIVETMETKPPVTGSQDTTVTEESVGTEVEDELERDEVVNCICEFYEGNGLMIQCEVCLCWQHAGCFGITDRTLPKKYICFVCENPPGVRESFRYRYDQDWHRHGQVTSFGYLPTPGVSEDRKRAIKATHSLVADIFQLNSVLHRLKKQLKVLRSKDESELKLWRLDWDLQEPADDSMETTGSSDQSQSLGPGTLPPSERVVKGDNSQGKGDNSKDQSLQHSNTGLGGVSRSEDNFSVGQTGADKVPASELNGAETDRLDQAVSGDKGDVKDDRTVDSASTITSEQSDTRNKDQIDMSSESQEGQGRGGVGTDQPVTDTQPAETGTCSEEGKTEMDCQPTADCAEGKSEDRPDPVINPAVTQSKPPCDLTATPVEGECKQVKGSVSDLKENESKDFTEKEVNIVDGSSTPAVDPDVSASGDIPGTDADKSGCKEAIELEDSSTMEDQAASDSTESAVDEDLAEVCERNLLKHIIRVQNEISTRLDLIEEQVCVLEAQEATGRGDVSVRPQNVLSDTPLLKRSLKTMNADLTKVKRMAQFH